MDKKQLIFLGAPGSGKGTQAVRISEDKGYSHVSTGDLLRREISKGSKLGERVKGILADGHLVDDHTVLELLSANCDLKSSKYIFDGFPRNIAQARLLDDELLKGVPSQAVYFEIALDKLLERLVNRRTCSACGKIYNLVSTPPKSPDSCDVCDEGELQQRKDDKEEVVGERLDVFGKTIEPMLEFYDSSSRLTQIDASLSADDVYSRLEGVIGAS